MELKFEELLFCASKIRSITHPDRVRIIKLLEQKGELTAANISMLLNMNPAFCSFQLSYLLPYGVVVKLKIDSKMYYSLDAKVLETIIKLSERLSKEG